jgi:outer membrane protein
VQSVKGYRAELCRAIGIAAILTMQASPALAQTAVPRIAPASTMAELVRIVIDTHPEIIAQREQVRVAKARLQGAEAGYLPTVEALGTVEKRENDIKSGGRTTRLINGEATIETRVRVFDGNRTYNAIKVSEAEVAAAEATLDAIISDILLELLTSAADVHLNRKVMQFSEMQSDAINEQLRSVSRRLEFGESTKTDENLAKARLATSQAGILAATEELNVNGYRFRSVSGQSATMVPPLPPLAKMPGSLIEAQTVGDNTNPRLRAAELNAKAGKAGVFFATGALMPELDVVGGYEYITGGARNQFTRRLPDDRSSIYGGLELRVPVFQPRNFAELRRAKALRDQREALTDSAERIVGDDIGSNWTRWQSAKSTIVTAEAAVAAIEQATAGLKRESVEGNRTLTDVLNAETELLAARVTLERAIRNEFVARASLLAAMGGLNGESVMQGAAVSRSSIVDRPGVSALGRPASPVANDGTVVQAAPARPAVSPLGRSGIMPASEADKAPASVPSDRPAVSTLGRKGD